jgi:hypothetical protein
MHEDVSNYGIIQHGGSMRVGNVAVGPGATILEQRGMAEVALRLRQLTQAVMEERSLIDDHPEVGEATSHLAAELRQREPRRNRVLQLLAVIAQGAGSVASVASAVESFKAAALAVL